MKTGAADSEFFCNFNPLKVVSLAIEGARP
jgi:hypothetical protein